MRTLFNLNPTPLNARSGQWRERLVNGLLIISLVALAIANNSWRLSAPEITSSAPTTSKPEAVTLSPQLAGAEADAIPKDLTASDWAGIKGEYERHRHAAFPIAGGHEARNHAQQWLTRFDGRGFAIEPEGANWRWGLELQNYGFAGSERSVQGKAQVRTETERVTYAWSDELDEWFSMIDVGWSTASRSSSGRSTVMIKLRLWDFT